MTVCAVDIGGTWTKVALVNDRGDLRNFHRIPTRGPIGAYIDSLLKVVNTTRAQDNAVSAIGVSVAGFIDSGHTELIYNPNLPWLERYPLAAKLREEFGVPVALEVDSNAAAIAEHRFGAGAGAERFLCLTVGTGIGGGFIANGQVLRITHECIGDVGHVIVEPGGRRCTCGGLGCAEAVATAPAILEASGKAVSSLEQLPAGPSSEQLFTQAGKYLGLLAASLASIFFPDCIALGGGVCEASPLVIPSALREFEGSASEFGRRNTRISKARAGSRVSLIGAAAALFGPVV